MNYEAKILTVGYVYDITLLSSEVLNMKIHIMLINLQTYNTILKIVNMYKL